MTAEPHAQPAQVVQDGPGPPAGAPGSPRGNAGHLRPSVQLDTEALYTAISRARRHRRIRSNREVLRQAGVLGPSILTRLGHGEPPATQNLIKLMLWLGETDLAPYLTTDEAKP